MMKEFVLCDGVLIAPKTRCEDIRNLTREEWLAGRKSVIGCSDAPKMMLSSKYGDPISLFKEKKDLVIPEEAPMEERLQLEIGHAIEPINIELFKSLNPIYQVWDDFTQYVHPKYEWMMGDFDFRCEHTENGEKFIGECKHHRDAKFVQDTYGGPMDSYIGDEYFWQFVQECAVSGADGVVLVVTGGNGMDGYRQRLFTRDLNAEKCLIEVGEYFYNDCLKKDILPDCEHIKDIMASYGFEPSHPDCDAGVKASLEASVGTMERLSDLDTLFTDYKKATEARLDMEKSIKDEVSKLKGIENEAKAKFYDALGTKQGTVALLDEEGNETLFDVTNTMAEKYEVTDLSALLLAYPGAKDYIKCSCTIKPSCKKSKKKVS